MSLLSPRGREEVTTASPWVTRPSAPTDHKMVERLVIDIKSNVTDQLTLPVVRNSEKHKAALDVSGLPPQANPHVLWDAINPKRIHGLIQILTPGRMTPTKAAMFGIALCAGAQLLKLKSDPFQSNNIVELLSKDTSIAPGMGVAISVGLQSLLAPLNSQPKSPPQAVMDDDNIASALSKVLLSDEHEMASNLISMPPKSLFESESVMSAASSTAQDEVPSFVKCLYKPVLQHLMKSEVDDMTWEEVEDEPSSISINWPHRYRPHWMEVDTAGQASVRRYGSKTPALANDNMHERSSVQFQRDESVPPKPEEEYQHLLGNVSMKKGVSKKIPAGLAHHSMKRYSGRSAGMGRRTLQSLREFKNDYKSLVENNELLI